jgi:hypothetical protein
MNLAAVTTQLRLTATTASSALALRLPAHYLRPWAPTDRAQPVRSAFPAPPHDTTAA